MKTMIRKSFFPRVVDLAETDAPRQAIGAIQGSIVDQVTLAFLVFAIPTCTAYLVLSYLTDFQAGANLFLGGIVFLLGIVLMRRRLPLLVRSLVIIGTWFALGIAGILCWGLAGSGLLFLISAGGLTALIFGPWAGSLAIVASLVSTALIAAAISAGSVRLPPSLDFWFASPFQWVFHSIAFGLFAAMVVFVLGRQHSWLKELILKLGDRSSELEQLNERLKTEVDVRREAEKALRSGEERLARILECAQDSFFVIAPDGRFTEVNSHACTSTGFSREELLTLSISDLDADFDQQQIDTLFQALANGEAITLEGRYRRKDGGTFPVEVNFGVMGEGKQASAIALARDISARKIAEEAAAYRYQCEKLVTEISARFIRLGSDTIDRNIELALEQICRFSGFDGAYLLLVDDKTGVMTPAHLWQSDHQPLAGPVREALAGRSMAWQKKRFDQNTVTAVSSIHKMPSEAGIDPQVLGKGGLRSVLEVPMLYRGSGVGVFGLVSAAAERQWSEKETGLLRMIAQVFTEALERKRAESALRNSEATLRSIVRAAPVGIGIAENDRILQGSEQLFAMLGYAEDELVGEHMRILYAEPKEFERARGKIQPLLETSGRADVETRWLRKGGKPLDILLNSAVVEPAGATDRITFTALDITERKRAEQALRESERNYREIYNATQEAILIYDADTGSILAVNQTMVDMFGYTEEEACRLPLGGISAQEGPYNEANAMHNIRLAVEKGPQVFEWRSRKKNGEVFWTEVTLKSTEIGGKGRVLGVFRDIDHRKKAERALRESEERFRNLVENAPAGICIVRNDRIIYMNPEQEKILGAAEEERDIYHLNLHPEDTARFMQHFRSVKEMRQSKTNLDVRIVADPAAPAPESIRWVHCDISVIPHEGVPAILITMVDMTRTKELEKLVHFREKMVSLGHVAAGIAHEIRNPLSGINVLIDGIRENFQDPDSVEDIRRLLGETQKASDKIAAVIKRVLDFSKPSQPRLTLTDINLPIKEALELSKTTLRKSGIDLETDLNASLPPLYIDEQMIEQAVMNLLSNAIEALKGDLAEKRLRVRSRKNNGYVIIDIADSGPGVPDTMRDKIFDPFYTTRSDGSGIGLSLCQRLIADHGGNISISSSEWGGAEFSIRIPTEKRMAIR
jgi:PAS domain S-box-containing protein